MDEIRLMVVFHDSRWKLKVGETLSRPYKSESEAISAAFSRARKLGREGFQSKVVMRVMTCQFGPEGLVKTVPNRARPTS